MKKKKNADAPKYIRKERDNRRGRGRGRGPKK